MENFSLTLTTFPSGVFHPTADNPSFASWNATQVDPSPPVICNPSLLEKYRKKYLQTPVAELSNQIVQKLVTANKVVAETGIEDYSRGLTELSIDLQLTNSDC